MNHIICYYEQFCFSKNKHKLGKRFLDWFKQTPKFSAFFSIFEELHYLVDVLMLVTV